jgi:hypothetical protein
MKTTSASFRLLGGALAGLAGMPAGFAAAVPAPVPYVIQLSVDGLGGIYLENLLATTPERYPNFHRLVTQGASTFNARCDYSYSETVQNHVCMITGRPVLQPDGQPATVHHGYAYNYMFPGWTIHNMGNPSVGYVASTFDVAHDHGLATACLVGKEKLAVLYQSYDENHGAPDLVEEDQGRNKVDFARSTEYESSPLVWALVERLVFDPPHYTFLHLPEPDIYGHYYGWGTPIWNAAVAVMDGHLGLLLAAIESNPQMAGRTTLVLTADHGGGYPLNTHVDAGHPLNYTLPLLVWGPGWPAGANLYDLFANRFNPGSTQPDYNAVQQPLRNGDAGNLALLALGLPPIPGSSLVPRPGSPQVRLSHHNTSAGLLLTWPSPSTDFVLECSAVVGPGAVWQAVNSGIADNGVTKSLAVTVSDEVPHQFYRLRKN